jgi:O-antigen ligase
MGVITRPDGADSLQAVAEAAGPWDLRVWAAPSCAAGLIVISALSMGGFWLRGAVVIGVGVLVLLSAVAWAGRVDRATALVLASCGALAAWWFVRALATGQPLSFFPFGVSLVGFAAAFAAIRPLTRKQKEIGAVFLASIGALEAAAGFYGITMRSTPLAIADQGLWRLASTVTYSDAAGLILAMSLLVALGLNERWWYSRGLVSLCVAGMLATQSRGALIAAACGMLFVPLARYRVLWLPLACGAIAGVVAVATSPSPHAEPIVGVALVLCVGASVALRPVAVVLATPRRVTFAVAGGLVVAGLTAIVVHTALALRLLTSAALYDRSPEWSSAYHQFLGAPWFGVGPDRLIPLLGGHGTAAHFAHNEYLQVAADAGVVGVALLLFAAVAVAKSVRRTDVGTSCALGALIAFALCGAFDFDWHLPVIALIGGCAAGLAGRAASEAPPDESRRGVPVARPCEELEQGRDPDAAFPRAPRPSPRP